MACSSSTTTTAIPTATTTTTITQQVTLYLRKKCNKGCLFYLVSSVTLLYIILSTTRMSEIVDKLIVKKNSDDRDLACRIPKLEPFDAQIRKSLIEEDEFLHQLGNISCLEIYPLLFASSTENYPPRLIPLKTEEQFERMSISTCCYRTIHRGSLIPGEHFLYPDHAFTLSASCYPINLTNYTEIGSGHDFIAIQCRHSEPILLSGSNINILQTFMEESTTETTTTIVDMHAFVHLRKSSEMESQNKTREDKRNTNERLNVLVIGLDAMSRMNFIRTFPKSHQFLVKTLSGVEMEMYNKIGDNSLPNLGPLLTNTNLTCEVDKTFDSCSFIWDKFAQQGYHTLFAEDDRRLATFDYLKNGFLKQPTEYYFRPFNSAADKHIASQKLLFSKICYGPRFAFQVMLDYLQKMSFVMSAVRKNYFQFSWSSSLTHDFLNAGVLADEHLYGFLKRFHEKGYLTNTMLIILGDHGPRWGPIRRYYQGQLEERLPAMYFVMPQWFREKYSRAYRNLQINRKRLVTVWDLHQTLLDVINLEESISEEKLIKKEMELQSKPPPPPLDPPGISLFLPISPERTCKMAGIPYNYCTCNHHVVTVETTNSQVMTAAKFAVRTINKIINSTNSTAECAELSLTKILAAGKISFGQMEAWQGYQLNFETEPGGAHFEALVVHDEMKLLVKRKWKISGRILRTNLYGNQSWCVGNELAKLYCYCKRKLQ